MLKRIWGLGLLGVALLATSWMTAGCEEEEVESAVQKPSSEIIEEGSWLEGHNLDEEITSVIEIEGMEEELKKEVVISENYPYAIYLSKGDYQFIENDNYDRIIPSGLNQIDNVYMDLWIEESKEAENKAEEIVSQLQEEYSEVSLPEEVDSPLPSWMIYGFGNDLFERYYIVDDWNGGSLIIRQLMVEEAQEGHGTRWNHSLQHLYLWNPETNEFQKP